MQLLERECTTPQEWRLIQTGQLCVHDTRPVMMTAWAGGHSYEQRLELVERSDGHCQHCGRAVTESEVHHPNRLAKRRHKQRPANIIRAAQEQQAKLLYPDCHRQHHRDGRHDATA